MLEYQDFIREIISNGKIMILQHADPFFECSGFIENIHVKNGQNISKGIKLVNLYTDDYKFEFKMKTPNFIHEKTVEAGLNGLKKYL